MLELQLKLIIRIVGLISDTFSNIHVYLIDAKLDDPSKRQFKEKKALNASKDSST